MRLHTFLAATVARTLLGLFALALPLTVVAQLIRLLPLLLAAAPAWYPTLVLAGGGVGLIAVTLTPPLLAVSIAVTLARWTEDGSLRLIASHGATARGILATARPWAALVAAAIACAGVVCEPPLARAMRSAAGTLGLRGLLGTLRRGGEVEPLPGFVLAAPHGSTGLLYVARVPPDRGPPETLRARSFDVREAEHGGVQVSLRGVDGALARDTAVHVERLTVALPPPAPPDDVVADDLTVSVAAHALGPARRHAARVLWGVLAYAAGMLAGALSLRAHGGASRRLLGAGVVPVAFVVATARLGALAVDVAHTWGGVWRIEAWVVLGVIVATESAAWSVAGRPWRVL